MEVIVKCAERARGATHLDGTPMKELVRCRDCKHNPKYTNDYTYGICVFCCEDDWYSETPDDDFYCGYGERREKM